MNNVGPPEEPFDKLLRWLDPNREKAAEKYERIRLRVVKILAARGCYEAEEVADKTIEVVESKVDWLLENYQGDPALYFYGVAKKLYLEWIKPGPAIPPPPDPEPPELEELCGYLDACLDALRPKDKTLALRYQEGEGQERIANRKRLA